jgi:serine/threonine-protein kinase RsbW
VSEIRLSVPARADYVHVLRSVTASVAAKLDFSFDDIEDLRLAVDEACAYLLGLQEDPTSLSLTITPSGGAVDVLASVDGEEAAGRGQGLQATMVWHLLGALTDEARFEESGGHPGIRFTKSAPAGASN